MTTAAGSAATAAARTARSYPAAGTVPVAVLVPTRDEAGQIEACLAALAWAAEVAVIDSESTDGTAERAAAAGARVWTRRFDGYGPQKNWALERLSHPWVLCVDADERATPELAREVAALFRRTADGGEGRAPAGYWIPRINHFLGRRIERCGWGGERVLRLFRRDRGRFDARRVHERVLLDGPSRRLAGALLHHPYPTWQKCAEKLWRYGAAGALEAYEGGRRAGPTDMLWRPAGRLLRMYVLQGGVLEGGAGAAVCGLAGAQTFLKYAFLWDLSRRGEEAARQLAGPAA